MRHTVLLLALQILWRCLLLAVSAARGGPSTLEERHLLQRFFYQGDKAGLAQSFVLLELERANHHKSKQPSEDDHNKYRPGNNITNPRQDDEDGKQCREIETAG